MNALKTGSRVPAQVLAFLFLGGLVVSTPSTGAGGEVVLQDHQVLAAFDEASGALTRLEDKATHWVIERRPQLGISFRLEALESDHRPDTVRGEKQHAVEVRKTSEHAIRCRWQGLVDEHGKVLPITLTTTVRLTNGALTFAGVVQNDSSLMVASLGYPYLGDLNRAPDRAPLKVRHMWYDDLASASIAPSQTVQTWQCLFCLIQSPEEGLYVEMQDPTQPYLINFVFEQRGSTRSTNDPVHMEFHAEHFVYVHPHSTRQLVPVVLQGYRGDWHAGVDLYQAWRATWFKAPHLPDWIKQVNSWQQLQIDSPVQDYRVPYTNLLAYGEECASNGVGAIQLVGWNKGGQDGGDPAQNTNPGLGTWQQLHQAIAQIQAKGVKIVLFAKLNWADLTTTWYSNQLYKYQCTDQNGNRNEQAGYAYYTPMELAGYGMHRRAVMDFLDPTYRNIATREFKKILALGPAGWLWDEVCDHDGVFYNWAPHHGYTPPGYVYAGDMPLDRQLWAATDQVNTNFLFAGEAPQDWLMQYFPCSYFRIYGWSTPVCRYLDPQAPLMVGVWGFDDREILNLILMDRYIISYEPYNFKGHLTDFPLTLAYGKKIDALRRKYKAYLWDATFRDTLGAQVTADGSHRYSVFDTTTGKRAVVVVNMEFHKAITAKVDLPHPGKLVVATPEDPQARPTDGTLHIPARSAAVVMEQ